MTDFETELLALLDKYNKNLVAEREYDSELYIYAVDRDKPDVEEYFESEKNAKESELNLDGYSFLVTVGK